MKVAELVKLMGDDVELSIQRREKSYVCIEDKDPYDCTSLECGDCPSNVYKEITSGWWCGKAGETPIKLADKRVLEIGTYVKEKPYGKRNTKDELVILIVCQE